MKKKDLTIFDSYKIIKGIYQKSKKIPTDPDEIHRRADEIRARLAKERAAQREKDRLQEDLDLIIFDLKMKGKL